jgi:hypothetical protein
VTCHEMDGVIGLHSRSSELPPEAAEHIAGCECCRRLVRVLGEKLDAPAPSAGQLKHIQAAMVENLKAVRPLAPSRIFLFAFALIFMAVVAVGSFQLGAYGWGVLSALQKIVVFATLAIGAGLLAISMVRQMAPGSKHVISPTLLPIGILVLLILVMAALFQSQEESAFVQDGLWCLRTGLTYSIPGAFLFWLLLRRGAILSPKLVGATAGGFAGLIGATVLEIHCPNLNRYHILVWHVGAVLLSALGGVALGAAVEYLGRWRNDRIS